MLKKYRGILALLVSVFCWGPGPVVSKLALTEVPEFSFAFLSRTLALIILIVLFLPKGYFKIDKKDLGSFIFAGFTGAFLNVAFFLYGLERTTAMNSQAIFTTAPVITAVLAHFILHERIKAIQFMAIGVGFFGAIVISLQDFFITGNFNAGNEVGNFFVFLAAVSWVGHILISKKLSKTYSPITITSYSFMVATVAFLPFALFESKNGIDWVSHIGVVGIFGILYQAIFASVIAFIAYQTGLKLTSAFLAGVALYLNPIITTIVAGVVLSEKISNPFILGTVLIIAGSLVATQYETLKGHYHRIRKKSI